MTALLYLLLFAFLLVEVPSILTIIFIVLHHKENGRVGSLRYSILLLAIGKFIFIFGQAILVFSALTKPLIPGVFVIWSYSLATLALFILDLWAFYRIRKLLINPPRK